MNFSGPPNPRQARYRQMPIHWSGCPVTILLIIISISVAALSRLGENSNPVASLFFANPLTEEARERWQERLTYAHNLPESSPQAQEIYLEFDREMPSTPYAQIAQGQVWRLATPMFLHFGPLHLIFNMMWLWTLGLLLETRLRHLRFGLLVAAIAVLSNLAEATFGGSTNFGGMSGVVYGLFGYVVVQQRLLPASGLSLDSRNTVFMLIWLVVCYTGSVGPIANWAHTIGLLTGAAIGTANALLNGGGQTIRRRREFRLAATQAPSLHQCAVCSKTEQQDPDLEFRVHTDDKEYCITHLPRNEERRSPNLPTMGGQ